MCHIVVRVLSLSFISFEGLHLVCIVGAQRSKIISSTHCAARNLRTLDQLIEALDKPAARWRQSVWDNCHRFVGHKSQKDHVVGKGIALPFAHAHEARRWMVQASLVTAAMLLVCSATPAACITGASSSGVSRMLLLPRKQVCVSEGPRFLGYRNSLRCPRFLGDQYIRFVMRDAFLVTHPSIHGPLLQTQSRRHSWAIVI